MSGNCKTFYANEIINNPKYRSYLTDGQMSNIREKTLNPNNIKLSMDDIENLMDIDIFNNKRKKILIEMLKEEIYQGNIKKENIAFVAFDSSYVSKYNIDESIKDIKRKLFPNEKSYIVLVDTVISQVENNYKIHNIRKKKYNNINFDNINHYLDITNKKVVNTSIDYLYNTEFYLFNEIINKIENKFLKNVKRYDNFMRNEMNDDVQIEILNDLKKSSLFGKFIMMSFDMGLNKKCSKYNILTIRDINRIIPKNNINENKINTNNINEKNINENMVIDDSTEFMLID